jgi:hypothetical protein
LEEETTVSAVCATTPEVKEELEELAFKESSAHITVTPHKEVGLPLPMEWNRFQRIMIEIDRYQDHNRPNRWTGMREIISRLRYSRQEILPSMTILFHEEGIDSELSNLLLGDAKWTEDMRLRSTNHWYDASGSCHSEHRACYSWYQDPIDEYLEDEQSEDGFETDGEYGGASNNEYDDAWLRTAGNCNRKAIAIEILDYFLDLPPCKSAVVQPFARLATPT